MDTSMLENNNEEMQYRLVNTQKRPILLMPYL